MSGCNGIAILPSQFSPETYGTPDSGGAKSVLLGSLGDGDRPSSIHFSTSLQFPFPPFPKPPPFVCHQRHAAFVGLREDKRARDVVRETE